VNVVARIGPAPRGPTLAQLALLAASGDQAAFEAIHARLTPGLTRMLAEKTNGRPQVVDDLVQRTWLATWESLQKGRYDPAKSAMTTFVYAVGYKMWLQYLRTAARPETLTPDAGDHVPPTLETPDDQIELAELLQTVRECLKNDAPDPILTDEERGVIRASAGGASDRDIAKQLNIAASTLNARKQGALAKIRRYLAAKGFRVGEP
jgi:RNA polymerase sigma factor (sigma-70 family)